MGTHGLSKPRSVLSNRSECLKKNASVAAFLSGDFRSFEIGGLKIKTKRALFAPTSSPPLPRGPLWPPRRAWGRAASPGQGEAAAACPPPAQTAPAHLSRERREPRGPPRPAESGGGAEAAGAAAGSGGGGRAAVEPSPVRAAGGRR